MNTIYGIKNCDTMKKAFAWLDEHSVAYTFHDYKKAGISSAKLHEWSKACGWRSLVNTRGTTWRKLTPEQQDIQTQSAAVQLMVDNPSLIRRPVIETAAGQLLVGFDLNNYSSFLKPGAAQ